MIRALLAALTVAASAADALAVGDWPIVAPGTSLQRVGNRAVPGSLRPALSALPVICDDGWNDGGQIDSPSLRFFTTGDSRAFVAVQCPGADADVTAVFENTADAVRTQSFAAFRGGQLVGTPLIDVLRIEPMTGVLISETDATLCSGEARRATYRLSTDGFVLLKAETKACEVAAWTVTYTAP